MMSFELAICKFCTQTTCPRKTGHNAVDEPGGFCPLGWHYCPDEAKIRQDERETVFKEIKHPLAFTNCPVCGRRCHYSDCISEIIPDDAYIPIERMICGKCLEARGRLSALQPYCEHFEPDTAKCKLGGTRDPWGGIEKSACVGSQHCNDFKSLGVHR